MYATLWYKGAVVLWMGFAGMSHDTCRDITFMMIQDIAESYSDPDIARELLLDGFEQQYWKTSCERRRPVDSA